MALYTVVGIWLGVTPWMFLWQILVLGNNFGGWTKPWLGKHLVMVLGIMAQLAAAWSIAAPLTPVAWWWIAVIAGTHFFLIAVQDLRDIAGDRVAGRHTLPLVIGERTTRWLLVACILVQRAVGPVQLDDCAAHYPVPFIGGRSSDLSVIHLLVLCHAGYCAGDFINRVSR